MTTEERLQKLEDALTVQAELVARFERSVDTWVESAENRFAESQVQMAVFRERMTAFEQRFDAFLERMDRFMRGREGNGDA